MLATITMQQSQWLNKIKVHFLYIESPVQMFSVGRSFKDPSLFSLRLCHPLGLWSPLPLAGGWERVKGRLIAHGKRHGPGPEVTRLILAHIPLARIQSQHHT